MVAGPDFTSRQVIKSGHHPFEAGNLADVGERDWVLRTEPAEGHQQRPSPLPHCIGRIGRVRVLS